MIAVIEGLNGLQRLVFGRENGLGPLTTADWAEVLIVSLDRDVRVRANRQGFLCYPDIIVGRVSTTRRKEAAKKLARAKSRALAHPWVARLTRRYFTAFNVAYHGLMSALRGPANIEADQIAQALASVTDGRTGDRFVVDGVVGALAVSALDIDVADVVLL